MSMEHWKLGQLAKGNSAAVKIAEGLIEQFGDIPFSSVAAPASNVAAVVEKPTLQTFSQDQLILPETQIPQEVSDILQRAEKAGIGIFEPYHLSGVTLTQDSQVEGWTKKPENWYWEQIAKGSISQDAPQLPDSWVLVDKTQKPDYKDGKQMYENDPFGPLLAKLRKNKKIKKIRGIPDTSRFRISHDELSQIVLPEIAKLLGVDKSQVRCPRAIEFNVIGNLKYQEWGNTNTLEWFNDKFEDASHLFGGNSGNGGLAGVVRGWSGDRDGSVGFRPLIVLSPKA